MPRIKVGELQSRNPYFESLPRTGSADLIWFRAGRIAAPASWTECLWRAFVPDTGPAGPYALQPGNVFPTLPLEAEIPNMPIAEE